MSYSLTESTYNAPGSISPDVYDDRNISSEYVRVDGDTSTCDMLLSGVSCVGCCRKIEHALQSLPGVKTADVDFMSRRLYLTWRKDSNSLSSFIRQIERLGFAAIPWSADKARREVDEEWSSGLKRLGVAGVFGMQVMTIAVAIYLGEYSGMSDEVRVFLTRCAMLLSLPVMFYSARPFLDGAVRAISSRRPAMDLTVCIAISLAFLGSSWAALTGRGDTWFESICMFVFLLTAARLWELAVRRRALQMVDHIASDEPDVARIVDAAGDSVSRTVAALELLPGNIVLVGAGERVPADATVVQGDGQVDEALVTGESAAVDKSPGDKVFSGSVNGSQPLWIRIDRHAVKSTFSRIRRLSESLQREKPEQTVFEQRLSASFIIAVLSIATITAVIWSIVDPSRALGIVIAVLAVACPCALALAAPAAYTNTTRRLVSSRSLPTRKGVIPDMAGITDIVFDKTGTLTESGLALSASEAIGDCRLDYVTGIAAALGASSNHPISVALQQACANAEPLALQPENVKHTPGGGVSGYLNDVVWAVGSAGYVSSGHDSTLMARAIDVYGEHRCWLTRDGVPVAWFDFSERLRPDAQSTVRSLEKSGIRTHILSGDSHDRVHSIAARLGIANVASDQSPEGKLNYIARLQDSGAVIAMVGDGINDSPALSQSDLSIAVNGAAPLATSHSDLVVLSERLQNIVDAIMLSRATRRIIGQNTAWAIGYNLLSVPFAAFGLIPPWAAATGMSLSSAIVLFNAQRLLKYKVRH